MITLTNSLTYGVGGTTVETATTGALVNGSMVWTYQGGAGPGAGSSNGVSGELGYGTWAAPIFTKSGRATSIYITLNLDTGAWTATSGQSGTLPANELLVMQNAFKAIRNGIEQFAAAHGIMPGTQTPW